MRNLVIKALGEDERREFVQIFRACYPDWAWGVRDIENHQGEEIRFACAYLEDRMVAGAIFELVPNGFSVQHMFRRPDLDLEVFLQVPIHFINRVWTMRTRHRVDFMVPDGEWDVIKHLQTLGCKVSLESEWFGRRDAWRVVFDVEEEKKSSLVKN